MRACTFLFIISRFLSSKGRTIEKRKTFFAVSSQTSGRFTSTCGWCSHKVSALDAYIYKNYCKYHCCSYVYLITSSLLNTIHVARQSANTTGYPYSSYLRKLFLSFGKLTHLDAKSRHFFSKSISHISCTSTYIVFKVKS